MSEDEEIDFEIINKVAQKVADFLFSDPAREKWYASIVEAYEQNNEFPSVTIRKINDYLIATKDENDQKLIDEINAITRNEENTENLLSSIFFPSEEEALPENDQQLNFEEEEEEDNNDDNNHDPVEYFEKIIQEIMKVLCISHDIAYVLLKKFCWNTNKITQDWFSKQEQILKSLKIKLNSKMVPNLKSPLLMQKIGTKECPICLEQKEIYRLYCGHELCKNCLILEAKQQIKANDIIECRQNCGAEIMLDDVKNLLDDKLFERYKKIVLQKEILLDPNVKECPNGDCNCIITPKNALPCHVGRCPCCYSVLCLRCNRGSHAPLISCERIDDFSTKIAEQMAQLEQDQESWFKREAELQSYRRSHQDEVVRVFEQEIKKIVDKHTKESREEQKRIDELDKETNQLQDQISKLTRKLNQYKNEHKPSDTINSLQREIDNLHETYNQKSGFRERLKRDKRVNDSERKTELTTAKKEESLFLEAIRDSSMYQRKIYEFEMSLNTRAYQNVSITSTDDDLVNTMTKKCPKCGTPIERNDGCNHMTCQICKYQFCYVCEEPWSTHSNYYICPKYKKDVTIKNTKGKSQCGIDFSNKNDKKFYPLPMSVEKRADFMRWNNLYTQFRIQKEKYDNLFKELNNKVDESVEKQQKNTTPLYKLCPINRVTKILQKSFNDTDAKILATKILNTILFAQQVITWSYPTMYYMMNEPKKAMVFEFKVHKIDENKNRLLELIKESCSDMEASRYTLNHEILEKSILDALEDAETLL